MITPRTLTSMANKDFLSLRRKDSAEISVDGMQSKAIRKTIKKVTFFPEVIMTETLHHKNYSKDERQSCWYSKSEYSTIKREFQETLKLVVSGKLDQRDDNDTERGHCLRGLEIRLFERSVERQSMRAQGRMLVFREQKIQEEQGITNDEAIAEEYTLLSKQCAFEAYNTGLMDEVDAFSNGSRIRINMEEKKRTSQQTSYFSNLFLTQGESLRNYLSCTDL
mmetsp:Transcript_22942/g.34803  ORF Transcript_22942/g.34803 Transcript_22942/m.34803 type:complete len:222 (-) Transcript_22942:1985-2650(-)